MRIKQVRVYQAVSFEQGSHNFFTANEFVGTSPSTKLRDLEISLLPSGYVRVVSEKCIVDIGPGNVAYIEYAREDYKAPPKAAKVKPA